MTLTPFTIEHALEIQIKGRFPYLGNDPYKYAKELYEKSQGTSFSAMENGEVLGCAGITHLWPGVGEAWSMFSSEIRTKPFFLHRAVKNGLDNLGTLFGYHRIELFVAAEFEVGQRWARVLGFELEGIRRKYTPDKKDIVVFVKFL